MDHLSAQTSPFQFLQRTQENATAYIHTFCHAGMIIFDTSAVIDFPRGGERTRTIVESVEKSGNSLAITTVSLFELLSAIYHRKLWQEEKGVRAFAQRSVTPALDSTAASEASKIMGALLRLGKPINALDVLISGIAISNGAEKIVSADQDLGEVEKVADISVQLL